MPSKLKFLAVLLNFGEVSRESSVAVYFEDADLERKRETEGSVSPKIDSPDLQPCRVNLFHHLQDP